MGSFSLEGFNDNHALNGVKAPLIAVSGGVDSMVLLHYCISMNLFDRFEVVYCNHGVRDDDEIATDIKVIEDLLDLHHHSLIIKDIGNSLDILEGSFETRARWSRLNVYREICEERSLDAVVLAHHLDDLCETMMMQLSQGVGARFRGIVPVNCMRGLRMCRPMLSIPKSAILEYASQQKVLFSVDSTNQSTEFLRNKCRHEIMPAIESMSPHYRDAFYRFSKSMTARYVQDDVRVSDIFKECLVFSDFLLIPTQLFKGLLEYDQSLVLLRCFELLPSSYRPQQLHISMIRDAILSEEVSFSIDLSKELRLEMNSHYLSLYLHDALEDRFDSQVITIGNSVYTSDSRLVFHSRETSNIDWVMSALEESVRLDAIHQSSLCIRYPKKGDKFFPLGSKKELDLDVFLKKQGIPFVIRSRLPLLVDAQTIHWVVGIRLSELSKLLSSTDRQVIFSLSETVLD